MNKENDLKYKEKFGEFPPSFEIDLPEQIDYVDKQVELALQGKRGAINYYEIVELSGDKDAKEKKF